MFKKNILNRKKILKFSFFNFTRDDISKLFMTAFRRSRGEKVPPPVLDKPKYEDPELRAIMTITPEQVIKANEMMKQGVKPKSSYAQRFSREELNNMLQRAFNTLKEK